MRSSSKKTKRTTETSGPAKKRLRTKTREEENEERKKEKDLSTSEASDEIEDSSEDSSEESLSDGSEGNEIPQKRRTKKSSSSDSMTPDTSESSDDGENLTSRTFQVESRRSNEKKREIKIVYRSNMYAVVREISRLTFNDDHMELLRISPFWLLIDAVQGVNTKKKLLMCKKRDLDLKKIIKSYSTKHECFRIGTDRVKLRNQDFRLIFGICDGTREIEPELKMGNPEWVKRCFQDEIGAKGNKRFSMERCVIYRKLVVKLKSTDRTDVEDAVRLVNCYMLAGLLITNPNGSMKNEVAALFEDLKDAVMYNWSQYMTDLLIRHIKATGGNKKSIGGCSMILPYFICEHSKIMKATSRKEFPRFLKWDLGKFHKKISRMDVSKIKGVKSKVSATSEEMDAFGEQFKAQTLAISSLRERDDSDGIDSEAGDSNFDVDDEDSNKVEETGGNETQQEGERNDEVKDSVYEDLNLEGTLGNNVLDVQEDCFVEETISRVLKNVGEAGASKPHVDDMIREMNDRLANENMKLQDEVDVLKKGADSLETEICSLKEALESKTKDLETMVNDKDQIIKKQEDTINELNEMLKGKESRVCELRDMSVKLQEKCFEQQQIEAELREQLKSFTEPSYTQVVENPVVQQHLDTIEKLCQVSAEKKSMEQEKLEDEAVIAEQKNLIDELMLARTETRSEPIEGTQTDSMAKPMADQGCESSSEPRVESSEKAVDGGRL